MPQWQLISPGVQGVVLVHVPPIQLSPMEQLLPQRPQLLESPMNDDWLTQEPMHEV